MSGPPVVILQTKLVSFVFLSLALALSLFLSPFFKSKERIAFVVVVFYLQKSGWLCDLLPKRACTRNAKFQPGLHEGVDVRTYGRFSQNQNFLDA